MQVLALCVRIAGVDKVPYALLDIGVGIGDQLRS
jgi:hypothetical protein